MIHRCARMCESVTMAQTVCVLAPAEDRERLLAIVADRNRPLKHVRRAQIVLCSADHLPVQEVAWRGARAQVDLRSGAGKCDTLSKASKACCVTRRASLAAPRFRSGSSPRCWT